MSGRRRFLAVSPEAVESKEGAKRFLRKGSVGVETWRFMTRPASCREMCVVREVESRARSSSSSMGRGGPREYPAFLMCLVMMVAVVVLLHTTCTTSGPAYSLLHFNSLVTRPASILSRLDVSTPAKERPLTLLIGTTATDEDGSLETAKTGANGTVMHTTPTSAERDHNPSESLVVDVVTGSNGVFQAPVLFPLQICEP